MKPTLNAIDERSARNDRVTQLLAASVIGVYLLVVVGATTAILDGARACPTWPACNGHWLLPLGDPSLVAAWGHRVLTLVVGGLLLVTTAVTFAQTAANRVRIALGVATLLYPAQIALGAITAVSPTSALFSGLHLAVAMTIFSGLLVALLWHLETATATAVGGYVATSASNQTDSVATAQSTAQRGDGSEHSNTLLTQSRAYVTLTKPKLMWLLCLVALAAMGLAAGPTLDLGTALATLGGGVLAIGASGTFNNVLERDVDQQMDRTADRPLVQDQIPVRRAIAFGVFLTVGSAVVFVAFVNALAAALGLLAILFYSVVYTLLLKPHTDQNVVIGGAVGAFPALIGWAAVENTVGVPALVLGAVIFLWTPAHFYNLALAYRDDYARADIPMLPVIRGAATTRRHVLLYLGATLVGAVALGAITRLGWVYAGTAVVMGGVFLWAVVRLFHEQTEQAAFRTFHAANAYLGAVLLAVLIDTMLL